LKGLISKAVSKS